MSVPTRMRKRAWRTTNAAESATRTVDETEE
jgi:hypothetical protein